MKRVVFILAAALLCACSPTTPAPQQGAPAEATTSAQVGALAITDAWASATPGGARVAGAYITIANTSDSDDRLVSASSSRAERVEIHETVVENDIARMRRIDSLVVPAHGALAMAPGGMHVMFVGISAPFAAGEAADVTLQFEHAGEVRLALPVRARGAEAATDAHAGHAH